ncbi:hypothetical protein B296_00018478, partial [Ensete ventricosum]
YEKRLHLKISQSGSAPKQSLRRSQLNEEQDRICANQSDYTQEKHMCFSSLKPAVAKVVSSHCSLVRPVAKPIVVLAADSLSGLDLNAIALLIRADYFSTQPERAPASERPG